MLVEHGDAEVCKHHPGFAEDLIVETDGETFAHWHLKHLEWADALSSGRIRVTGPRAFGRALPTWNRRGFSAPGQTRRNPGQLTGSTASRTPGLPGVSAVNGHEDLSGCGQEMSPLVATVCPRGRS
jgi:hypothetical protein